MGPYAVPNYVSFSPPPPSPPHYEKNKKKKIGKIFAFFLLVSIQLRIVFFTNQKGLSTGTSNLSDWRTKIDAMQAKLDIPILVLAATSDDLFRKPRNICWDIYHSII